MFKKLLLPLLFAAIIIALFFIKVEQQKTVSVKADFLSVYAVLSNPQSWLAWQGSLRKAVAADSNKVTIQKRDSGFTIKYDSLALEVKKAGTVFEINQNAGGKASFYNYSTIPGEFNKMQGNTSFVTSRQVSIGQYLIGLFSEPDFSDTHADDIRQYFAADSLHYGFSIFKSGVPEADLIEVSKQVLKKDQFTTAVDLLADLQAYVKRNKVKQMQPLIAQFLRKGPDSIKVNVGFFIDRQVKSETLVHYVHMPLGGALYCAVYKGPFNKRQKAYNGLYRYFTDHLYQQAIVPFETYLDNKLPKSDTDKINIRINYTAYY